MNTLRLAGAVFATALVGLLAFASAGVAAPPSSSSTLVSVPVSAADPTGTFAGTLNITNFVAQNGQVSAVGTLVGTVTNLVTGAVTTISQSVTAPLQAATGSCSILHLDLGPIDLNVLGLQLTTNEIVIDLSAQPGPGALLGNLLCGITNALNSGASATAIANLLNNVLGLL
jgi:hypothetical protein